MKKYIDEQTLSDIISNLSSQIDEIKNTMASIENCYPIGSVYISVNNVNPSYLFGGTWEQIKDKFLLAAGSTYSGGSTGGEASHTLTTNEIPSHTHIQLGLHGGSANSSPVRLTAQNDGNLVLYDGSGKAIWYSQTSGTTTEKLYRTSTLNQDGVTGSTGGSQPHNNMPPYLAVYMWKRIS